MVHSPLLAPKCGPRFGSNLDNNRNLNFQIRLRFFLQQILQTQDRGMIRSVAFCIFAVGWTLYKLFISNIVFDQEYLKIAIVPSSFPDSCSFHTVPDILTE